MKTNSIIIYCHKPQLIINMVKNIRPFMNDYNVTIFTLASVANYNLSNYHLEDVEVIDISWFSIKKVLQLISEINPVVLITFTYRSFFEIMIYSVISKKVKIIFVEHGILGDMNYNNLFSILWNSKIKILYFVYFTFSIIFSFKNSSVRIVWSGFFKFLKHSYGGLISFYVFFTEASRFKLGTIFEIRGDNFIVLGIPMINYEPENQINNQHDLQHYKTALIIHQPFIREGLVRISLEEEKKYFLKIIDALSGEVDNIIIQLHPADDLKLYSNLFSERKILLSQKNLDSNIKKSSLVIGFSSMAIHNVLYFQKKCIILDYPTYVNNYIDYFTSLGVKYIKINDLSSSLKTIFEENYHYKDIKFTDFETLTKSIINNIEKIK